MGGAMTAKCYAMKAFPSGTGGKNSNQMSITWRKKGIEKSCSKVLDDLVFSKAIETCRKTDKTENYFLNVNI